MTLVIPENFNEGERDAIDDVLDRLVDELRPVIADQWLGPIRQQVQNATSLEELRDQLFPLFPEIASAPIVGPMERAMLVATAGGAYDAATEAE